MNWEGLRSRRTSASDPFLPWADPSRRGGRTLEMASAMGCELETLRECSPKTLRNFAQTRPTAS